jgi:hypothetical protein
MAQYAILLYGKAPVDSADLTPEERAAHARDEEDVERLGATMLAACALEPSTTATSVRGDVVTDGPFVEAKEVVAGFYVTRHSTSTPPWRSRSGIPPRPCTTRC